MKVNPLYIIASLTVIALFAIVITMTDKMTILNQNFDLSVTHYEQLLTEVKPPIPKPVLVDITIDTLAKDLKSNYSNVGLPTKAIILESIMATSKRYNINPIILYSLIHVESSFRFWKEHKQTKITYKGKTQRIKAVGLGGVVWEIHGEALQTKNIAQVRSDLFDPKTNIEAIGYIFSHYRSMKLHPKASSPNESALLRYFGGSYPNYVAKINKKISQLINLKLY